jgi:hypothetical protein
MSLAFDYGLVKHVICDLLLVGNSINSDRPRIGNIHLLLIDGGSTKGRWVGKSFTDGTYNNPSGGLVKPLLPMHHQILILNRGVV